jgi:hypothetical protein
MHPGLDPLDGKTALLLFRLGWDTTKIARAYDNSEAFVANMLATARDQVIHQRELDEEAFDKRPKLDFV